jgi:hypothetical protein
MSNIIYDSPAPSHESINYFTISRALYYDDVCAFFFPLQHRPLTFGNYQLLPLCVFVYDDVGNSDNLRMKEQVDGYCGFFCTFPIFHASLLPANA